MKPVYKYCAPLLVAAGALGTTSPALAQDAKNTGDYQTLTEVVVTAQKVAQAAIDVPASVTAVSGEALASEGLTRFEDYAAQVPGMSVTALTPGYSSVVLRGISTGISQATSSTGYYIDEAPIGSVTAYATGGILTPDLDPDEVQRIEVLKGPQGTLYGAGAVGGLVRFVTSAPSPQQFGGSVSFGAQSVDDGGTGLNGRVALNVPLGDSNALRGSLFSRTDPGYIDDPLTGRRDVNRSRTAGGRLGWNWQIDSDWSLYVWGFTQRFTADGISAMDVTAPALTPVAGDLTRSTYIPETQKITFDVYNATLKGKVGDFALVSSTTYQTIDATTNVDVTSTFGPLFGLLLGIPNLGAETTQAISTQRWSEELRLSSVALHDALQYTGGLYFTHEDSSNTLPPVYPFLTPSLTPFTLLGPLANASIVTRYQEYSPFANASYDITSQFDLQAGLRYSHYTENYAQNYQAAILSPVPVLINQDVGQDKMTYLVAARYKPTKDTAIYARVATGFRPGGPSALPPGVIPGGKQSFDPDTVTSYELGLKSDFAGGKASVEAAVFTTDWKDVQIQTSATTATGTYQFFVNGGTAKSDGVEATLLFNPVMGLSLRATGAYTDSRLTSDAPAAGGLDGDRMPFSPHWTASLLADYHFHVGGDWEPFVGASWNYIGDRVSNFSDHQPPNPTALPSNKVAVPSYTTFNLNAGFDVSRVRVRLYGKNLGNSRGINFINSVGFPIPVANPLGNPFTEGVIPPRTLGADVSYRF